MAVVLNFRILNGFKTSRTEFGLANTKLLVYRLLSEMQAV